jgi:hypothetical protein
MILKIIPADRRDRGPGSVLPRRIVPGMAVSQIRGSVLRVR